MLLKEIFDGTGINLPEGTEKTEISDIIYNSSKAGEGMLFTALNGYTTDGHKYVSDAYGKGVRVFLVDKDGKYEKKDDAVYIESGDTRETLSHISANFFSNPSREMTVIGITGTKGKTTVSHYLRDILELSGRKTGIIGTMGCFYGPHREPTSNTTPESYEIHRIMRKMLDAGYDHLVMEVSSGGIMNHRVDDISFRYGIFLNLSHDHIGAKEHPTYDHYRKSKGEMFEKTDISVLNMDDIEYPYFLSKAKGRTISFGIENENADIRALNISEGETFSDLGESFDIVTEKESFKVNLNVPGIFSIYNTLSAAAVALDMGIRHETVQESAENFRVKGRMDILKSPADFNIIIDYAHNEDSMRNALETIESHGGGRIIVVIGTVGGRTEERRKELAEAASAYADIIVFTEDNPDFEDPDKIIDEMAAHVPPGNVKVLREKDRKKAVHLALSSAEKGDTVLIAGKGHESYNLVKGVKVPYSDYESVSSYFTGIEKDS